MALKYPHRGYESDIKIIIYCLVNQAFLLSFFPFIFVFTLLVSLNSEKCFFSVWTQSGSLSPFSDVYMSPRRSTYTDIYIQSMLNVGGNVRYLGKATYQCIHLSLFFRLHLYQYLPLFPEQKHQLITVQPTAVKRKFFSCQCCLLGVQLWVNK